jgi:hypothetical protein
MGRDTCDAIDQGGCDRTDTLCPMRWVALDKFWRGATTGSWTLLLDWLDTEHVAHGAFCKQITCGVFCVVHVIWLAKTHVPSAPSELCRSHRLRPGKWAEAAYPRAVIYRMSSRCRRLAAASSKSHSLGIHSSTKLTAAAKPPSLSCHPRLSHRNDDSHCETGSCEAMRPGLRCSAIHGCPWFYP